MGRPKISETESPQTRYNKNQSTDGLVRISVWVPEADRPEMIQKASDMRDKYFRTATE